MNLFSLYDTGDPNPIFQIDANLAYPAVLLVSAFIKRLCLTPLHALISLVECIDPSARRPEFQYTTLYNSSPRSPQAMGIRFRQGYAHPRRNNT